MLNGPITSCIQFSDKHLSSCLEKVDKGIEKLKQKYPDFKAPALKSGLRGIRYFVEFDMRGRNIDVFSLMLEVQDQINKAQTERGKVTKTDTFKNDDSRSYLIDYKVASSTAMGGNNTGSVFTRGV